MDINEKIVIAWLNHKQYFVIGNIDYGQFHENIDILAVNIKEKEILNCEVKVRTGKTLIGESDKKQNGFQHFVNQLKSAARQKTIIDIIGVTDYKLKDLFITTKSLLGVKNKQKWIDKFKEKNIDVLFIEDIVQNLEDLALKTMISSNEIIQILRLQQIKNSKKEIKLFDGKQILADFHRVRQMKSGLAEILTMDKAIDV